MQLEELKKEVTVENNKNIPIILDCDTGEDDAIAIVLSIMANLPLKYIVTCHGNTTLDHATDNTVRILGVLDAENIQLIKGATYPTEPHKWEPPGFTAGTDFLGNNGLCNLKLPRGDFKDIFEETDYLQKLENILITEKRVDYIITGPCTNFALLCRKMGPSIKKYIRNLYIMGGAVHVRGTRGAGVKNTSHDKSGKEPLTWAEFNFYCDPYAIKEILSLNFNPLLVTWDQCIQFELPFSLISRMKSATPGGKFIVELMHAFMKIYGLKNKTKFELCDPLTIMAYMGYGKERQEKINLVTDKNLFGKSYPDKNGYPVRYFYVADKSEVDSIISSMLSKLQIKINN